MGILLSLSIASCGGHLGGDEERFPALENDIGAGSVNQLIVQSTSSTDVTKEGFTIQLNVAGDVNENSSATMYYCNDTDNPGCDPVSDGTGIVMTSYGTYKTASVSGFGASDYNDTISITIISSDPDGVDERTLTTTVNLVSTIYRSVGYGSTTALASGAANPMTITSSTASFEVDLPNKIGVGDVIEYTSTSGTSYAFIHGRNSAHSYTVKKSDGSVPDPTDGSDTTWSLFRAYITVSGAESGTENTGLGVNFDTWASGKDLVTSGEQWNIACYADAVGSGSNWIQDWETGPKNYLRFFTPVSENEVGESQRHNGTWGTGFQILDGFMFNGEINYVRIEGIAIKQTGNTYVYTHRFWAGSGTDYGDIRYSNNIGWGTNTTTMFDIFGSQTVDTNIEIRYWNNIAIRESTNTNGAPFYIENNGGHYYYYNNTAVSYGKSFSAGSPVEIHLVNNIGYVTNPGTAFSGTFTSGSYNASNDASADNLTGTGNLSGQTFQFADEPGSDFRLSSSSPMIGAGTVLTGDSIIDFSDDIEGETRGSSWDIGADEY